MDLENITTKFNEFHPNGKIEEISLEEIPQNIMNYFEARSKRFILPKDYQEKDFEKTFTIHHDNHHKTYVAIQTKTYCTDGDTEELTYLIDINEENKPVGYGEIRFNISNKDEYFINKPFVGSTNTSKKNRRKGIGKRRLHVMNALCQTLYKNPLNSDTIISEDSKKLWEKLTQEGKSKMYKEGEHDRYVFLTQP